jgi:hypothetical protein
METTTVPPEATGAARRSRRWFWPLSSVRRRIRALRASERPLRRTLWLVVVTPVRGGGISITSHETWSGADSAYLNAVALREHVVRLVPYRTHLADAGLRDELLALHALGDLEDLPAARVFRP